MKHKEWRVSLLGPFRLEVDGVEVPVKGWKSKKALSLFQIILSRQGDSVARETLLDALWPDEPEDKALRCLHTTMYFLRQQLQPYVCENVQVSSVLLHESGRYWFRPPGGCGYDTKDFETLFARGIQAERLGKPDAVHFFLNAIKLYRGPFMAELPYDDWMVLAREHYMEIYVQCILKAAKLMAARGDMPGAVRLCRLGLVTDPHREDLHEACILHLLAAGRYRAAKRQFHSYRKMICDELGVEPHLNFDLLLAETLTR